MTLPTLQEGSQGEAVRVLEQLLSSLYWFGQSSRKPVLVSSLVKFDAQFDAQTTALIREFQKNYSLNFPPPAEDLIVDGVVGNKTWRALGDAIFRYSCV